MNGTKRKNSAADVIRGFVKSEKFGLVIALIVMVIVFSICTKGKYILKANIINILLASSIVGLVAIGESFILIGGQSDLSPGSVSAFSGVLVAILLRAGWNMFLAIITVLIVGAVIGLFNALMVNKMKIAAFIATLATMSICRGSAYIICNGKAVSVTNQAFLKIGSGRVLGIPIPGIILIVMLIIFGIVLSRTGFGRKIYMIGGNATAARLAGINDMKLKTILFVLSAMLSAFGGCILAARMNSGQPSASDGLEFDAITAAVLGGVAFTGGSGDMLGTLIGLLILQGFNNGILMMNIQSFWQIVLRGVLLVLALAFDFFRRASKNKA